MGTSRRSEPFDTEAWRRVRDRLADTVADLPADDEPVPVDDLVNDVADAIADGDPTVRQPQQPEPLFDVADLIARPRGSADGPGGGGGGGDRIVRAPRQGDGDTGAKKGRQAVMRQASRGGITIGVANSYRAGNAAALAEYGLDIESLNALLRGSADRRQGR